MLWSFKMPVMQLDRGSSSCLDGGGSSVCLLYVQDR